jgi:hypothetical protein
MHGARGPPVRLCWAIMASKGVASMSLKDISTYPSASSTPLLCFCRIRLSKIEAASENDFLACWEALRFQIVRLLFLLDFEVRFLGTAITSCLKVLCKQAYPSSLRKSSLKAINDTPVTGGAAAPLPILTRSTSCSDFRGHLGGHHLSCNVSHL